MFDEAGEDELLLAATGGRGAARGVKWTKKDVSTTLMPLSGTVAAASKLVCESLSSEVRDCSPAGACRPGPMAPTVPASLTAQSPCSRYSSRGRPSPRR